MVQESALTKSASQMSSVSDGFVSFHSHFTPQMHERAVTSVGRVTTHPHHTKSMKNKLFKVEGRYLPQTLTLSSFHTSLNTKKALNVTFTFQSDFHSLQQRKKKNLQKRSIGTSLSPDVGERACVHVCVCVCVCEKEN